MVVGSAAVGSASWSTRTFANSSYYPRDHLRRAPIPSETVQEESERYQAKCLRRRRPVVLGELLVYVGRVRLAGTWTLAPTGGNQTGAGVPRPIERCEGACRPVKRPARLPHPHRVCHLNHLHRELWRHCEQTIEIDLNALPT